MENHLKSQNISYFPPKKIFILGAGHFGYVASKRLSRRYAEASFLVIDSNRDNLAKIEEEIALPVLQKEAISFINSCPISEDQWIIPAIPVHVAFHWLLHQLKLTHEAQQVDVPQLTDEKVPNPFRMDDRTLYASYATFVCPDACNEPDEFCTYTGKPRQENLFEYLQQVEVPGFATEVVRSWQLAPGVGGYTGSTLSNALASISRNQGSYLVATSCRCHSVIDALKWTDA